VELGGLGDAWHVMRFYEACLAASDGPVELTRPLTASWLLAALERRLHHPRLDRR
jgi:hypothetical protein